MTAPREGKCDNAVHVNGKCGAEIHKPEDHPIEECTPDCFDAKEEFTMKKKCGCTGAMHAGDCVGKPLSAEERVVEIMDVVGDYCLDRCTQGDVEKEIASQLVAFGEEREGKRKDWEELCWTFYRRGIEEAAEICLKYHEEVDGTDCMCDEGIAAVQLAKQISGLDKGAKE